MHCPKCGFEQPDGSIECTRCGVIFAKRPASDQSSAPRRIYQPLVGGGPVLLEHVEDGRLGKSEIRLLGLGLAAAAIVYALPFLRFLVSALVTLLHELGHTTAAWLLGHPAIPSFDLVYGGGMTDYRDFQKPLALLIGGTLVWAGWLARNNRKTLVLIGTGFALWFFVISSAWRRELVISAAGHLAELIFAGIFLYMTLANVGWKNPAIERPLGAFIAFYVQINSMAFALRLRNDPDFLEWYLEGKGGMLMNDLESVALDLYNFTGINLGGVKGAAAWLLVFSFVPMTVALLMFLFRSRVHAVVSALRDAEG
jgi:hypothetical protein